MTTEIKNTVAWEYTALPSDWDDFDERLANYLNEGWQAFGADMDYGDCYNIYLRRNIEGVLFDYTIITDMLSDDNVRELVEFCANGWVIINQDEHYEEFWLCRERKDTPE